MELTTDQKGAIAESAIVHAAIKLGIGVFKPLTDGHRYDLIFEVDDRLLPIQCKWAVQLENVVMVRCYSARRTINGMLNRPYTADEVDLIAAYCAAIERCFILPPDSSKVDATCISGCAARATTRAAGSTGRMTTCSSG